MEILLVIIGAILSWIVAHFYYKLSNKDQNNFFNKFSVEVRNVFLEDKRNTLTVLDINDILKHKIIDKNIPGLFKYKICPKCGSEDLSRSKDYWLDVEKGDDDEPFYTSTPYDVIDCTKCGWRKTEIENKKEAFED